MRASRIAFAFAVVGLAGAAHAQSFIPGNQIDDFGSFTYRSAEPSQPEKVAGHASIIPGNQIDDFGAVAPSRMAEPDQLAEAQEAKPAWHASIIPGNQVDDFSVPAGSSMRELRLAKGAEAKGTVAKQ